MTTTGRRWSYALVIVVVLAYVGGIGHVSAMRAVRGSMAGHVHAEEDATLPPTAAAATATDAFDWKRVTQYEFDMDAPARMISFCTSKPTVRTMVFALLPINSTVKSELETAAREASRMANAFDSSLVVKKDVTQDTAVQLTSVSAAQRRDAPNVQNVLYRARLGAAQQLSLTRCVDAVLTVTGSGMFLLFAEHAQANVSISIVDALQRAVPYASCLTGCDDRTPNEIAADVTTVNAMAATHGHAEWESPVGASIVVALVSLIAVLVLSAGTKHVDVIVDYMMSFAAGCLLAVTMFHLYPEGSAYVSDMGEWVAGACVLGGIALSMAFELTLHLVLGSFRAQSCQRSAGGGDHSDGHGHGHGHRHGRDLDKFPHKNEFDMLESVTSRTSQHVTVLLQSLSSTAMAPHRRPHLQLHLSQSIAVLGPNDRDSDTTERPSAPLSWRATYLSSLRTVAPIAWITAVGDFVHAFTDGVVLAVAFKSCSSSLGWAVALGIVLHEVPHRVGDHFIFLKAGMLLSQALALNFLASLASLLAVIIVLSVGSVSDHTLGILLSVGAGTLLFIALVKLLPPMLDVRHGGRACLHLLCFVAGCTVIGLSMLQHSHCDVAGAIDTDAAHAHGTTV